MTTMHEVAKVARSQLKAAAYNPRLMRNAEFRNLVESIREFGFVEPVVARRDDSLVIGGHQRLAALDVLIAEGAMPPDVPVTTIFLDGMTEDRTRLLNIALNRIHGEWDYEKLHALLETIESATSLSGMSQKEVDDLAELYGAEYDPPEGPLDDVDALIAERARRFVFVVPTVEQAKEVGEALRGFGMTGPGNAAEAFVALARAGLAHRSCEAYAHPPTPEQRVSQKKARRRKVGGLS